MTKSTVGMSEKIQQSAHSPLAPCMPRESPLGDAAYTRITPPPCQQNQERRGQIGYVPIHIASCV